MFARIRLALVICFCFWLPGIAPEPASAQVAVTTVQSVDSLFDSMRYLLKTAGKENEIAQVEGLLETFFQGKGIPGIDGQKPFGFYFKDLPLGDNLEQAIAFAPIAKEADFIDLLKRLELKVGPANDQGMRTVESPFGVNVVIKFAHGYVYAASKEKWLRGKLLDPRQELPAASVTHLLVNQLRVSALPESLKASALKKLRDDLAAEMNTPTKSAAEKDIRQAILATAGDLAEALMEEGLSFTSLFHIDREKHWISFDAELQARPGTSLAQLIADFGAGRTRFQITSTPVALHAALHYTLPEKYRPTLAQLVDALKAEALAQENNEIKKAVAERVFQILDPTLKSGVLDVGLALHGPDGDNKFGLVAALQVREGKRLEKLVKDLLAELPAEQRKALTLNYAEVEGVQLHRVTADPADPEQERIFGKNPYFLAFRDDAVMLAGGVRGEALLRGLLSAEGPSNARQPTASATTAPLLVEMHLARLLPLNKDAAEYARSAAAAREVFKEPDQDLLRLTAQGSSDTLRLKFGMHSRIIALFAALSPE